MSLELLISDYAGHGFTAELSRTLRERGLSVSYSYCAAVSSPKGALDDRHMIGVCPRAVFEKYQPAKRILSELRYGLALTALVWRSRPRAHVLCNMPVISALTVWLLTLPLGTRIVIWLQDIQSGLAEVSLGGGSMARAFSAVESFALRRAQRVVAISAELASEARRRRVPPHHIRVLENWAPIDQIPVLPRENAWSREQRLAEGPRFIYAGTLARKHDPSLLTDLARAVLPFRGEVIVVSEGEGADWIREAVRLEPRSFPNVRVLPYQPFERLAEVLAAADVLVVVLEPAASAFSVPSKTLSYLCAGRSILASIPHANAAAHTINQASAGLVFDPSDRDGFLRGAVELTTRAALRAELGANGRRYAQCHFVLDDIATRFLASVLGA